MAERISRFEPAAVFELGCNAGEYLRSIEDRIPGVFVSGLDVNSRAVSYARDHGRRAAVGDERCLDTYPDRAFDVSFTVSVLDHFPEAGPTLRNLLRMSGKAVLLMEPWLGYEGKGRSEHSSGKW